MADEVITDTDYRIGTDYHRYEIRPVAGGGYEVTVNGLDRGTYTTMREAEARVVDLKIDYQTYLKTDARKIVREWQ